MIAPVAGSSLEQLVEQFQCPGCLHGSDTKCGKYKRLDDPGRCDSHVLGTLIFPLVGNVALGLPKGFNRAGWEFGSAEAKPRIKLTVRLFPAGKVPEYDRFNVAVWAMEQDGFLFVRAISPRINDSFVDVIEGGTLALVPNAINVGEFIDEID